MSQMITTWQRKAGGMLVCLVVLSGCAAVPDDGGFSTVTDELDGRLAQEVAWRRGGPEEAALDRRVDQALQEPLTEAAAVQIALLAEIDHRISSPADLFDHRVGVVADSAAQLYMTSLGIPTQPGPSIEERIEELENGNLDAVVHHAPFLQYYASHAGNGKVRVSGVPFSELDFGIALPEGSPYREQLNRALLRLVEDGTYQRIHDRWF